MRPQDPTQARELIADWLRSWRDNGPSSLQSDSVKGLDVPNASARHVVDVIRAVIARTVGAAARPNSFSQARPLAEALILDQHPSAGDWTASQRREVLDWLTLLIDELGEDGVSHVIAALNSCP